MVRMIIVAIMLLILVFVILSLAYLIYIRDDDGFDWDEQE
jgi:hypothetical protein